MRPSVAQLPLSLGLTGSGEVAEIYRPAMSSGLSVIVAWQYGQLAQPRLAVLLKSQSKARYLRKQSRAKARPLQGPEGTIPIVSGRGSRAPTGKAFLLWQGL